MANEAEAKKVIQERRDSLKKAQEEGTPKGKPTPTQEELDLAMMGVPLEKHEDDGSGPDYQVGLVLTRQTQPERTGQPQPRQTTIPPRSQS